MALFYGVHTTVDLLRRTFKDKDAVEHVARYSAGYSLSLALASGYISIISKRRVTTNLA
jgi:hypothetical protein